MPSHPQQHDPSGEACEPYTPGYVNLWEAIEQAGKGLYPGTWTGKERLRTPVELWKYYDPKDNILYAPVNLSYAGLLPTLNDLKPPQTNVEIEALTIFHNEGLNLFYLKVEQEEEKARLTPTLGFDEEGMMRCNLAMQITKDDVLEALNSEHKVLIEETFNARKRLKKLLEACRFCFLKSKVSAFWYNDETGKRNKIPAHTWSIKAAQLALESSHPGVWIKQRTELPVFVKDLALKKAVVQAREGPEEGVPKSVDDGEANTNFLPENVAPEYMAEIIKRCDSGYPYLAPLSNRQLRTIFLEKFDIKERGVKTMKKNCLKENPSSRWSEKKNPKNDEVISSDRVTKLLDGIEKDLGLGTKRSMS